MTNSFIDLINERQSCRNFSEKPIKEALIYEIIEIAKNAPSACNSQPWRVYITCDPSENEKMRECLQDEGKNAFLNSATAFVAVYQTEEITLKAGTEIKFSTLHFAEYDIGEFVAYFTLAAKYKGIDSCIIGWVDNKKINKTFGLNGKCDLVVALGYSAEGKTRNKKRKQLSEIIINYKEV